MTARANDRRGADEKRAGIGARADAGERVLTQGEDKIAWIIDGGHSHVTRDDFLRRFGAICSVSGKFRGNFGVMFPKNGHFHRFFFLHRISTPLGLAVLANFINKFQRRQP